jgi:tetratricopeptide (TPR) repeat protein/tRNA A-37 threonylcarbamoyl transferase component Bud32
MNPFSDLFRGLFGRPGDSHNHSPGVASSVPATILPEQSPSLPKGQANSADHRFIGQKYEVYGTLGGGGFGIVYLVYSHETKAVYALKTFRDEDIADPNRKELFRREARIWIELGYHPYIVNAFFVDEVNERLYLAMDYIAPNEGGLNTLAGYLSRKPPDITQSLIWSIQFCHGMEYAYSRGLRCHRDIKPTNILISADNFVKIADFGLAGVLGSAKAMPSLASGRNTTAGLSPQSTVQGTGFGTPTHMAPEQFLSAATCDERSDIYSFGIVMYQMVSGGKPPFITRLLQNDSEAESIAFWTSMFTLHTEAPVPEVDSPLFPIIQQCLRKQPSERYQGFQQLREDLARLLIGRFPAPFSGSIARAVPTEVCSILEQPQVGRVTASDLTNKGNSLGCLGQFEEALACFDMAIATDPQKWRPWNGKANSLRSMGRFEDAKECYDRALAIVPKSAPVWANKGNLALDMGLSEDAAEYFDRALSLDPYCVPALVGKGVVLSNSSQYAEALRLLGQALQIDPQNAGRWNQKAIWLKQIGKFDEALQCYDAALALEGAPDIWRNKGLALHAVGRLQEALQCFDNALAINPRDANAWNSKGSVLRARGNLEQALHCFDCAIDLDPRSALAWSNKSDVLGSIGRYDEGLHSACRALELDCDLALAWNNKGNNLCGLGRPEEALPCFDRAIELDPTEGTALNNKGCTLNELGRFHEAIDCLDKALSIDQRDAMAWNNKGISLHNLGRLAEAVHCYHQALQHDPTDVRCWRNNAAALKSLGRVDEANRCLKMVAELEAHR